MCGMCVYEGVCINVCDKRDKRQRKTEKQRQRQKESELAREATDISVKYLPQLLSTLAFEAESPTKEGAHCSVTWLDWLVSGPQGSTRLYTLSSKVVGVHCCA